MKHFHFIVITAFVSLSSFAQTSGDTANHRFQDDLLNHLAGKWNVTSVAHGFSSTAGIESEWTLNHQHLHLHFKGNEVIPWIGAPMEFDYFIGYNHNNRRYVIHAVSIFGNDDDEGFWYGYRNGNEIKILQKSNINSNSDTLNVQRLIWIPASNSWRIESRPEIAGREGEVFLDMRLEAIKPSSK
jgi:hypothetical protein